jgi:apolipoprotein N-acyltransferase
VVDFRVLARRWGSWVAAPAGALLAVAFAPLGIFPLAVACPAILFLLWEQTSPRTAAWRGFLFTAGLFLAGTYWIYHSVHTIGGAPLWVTLFVIVAMIAILSSYTAGFGYAVQRWGARGGLLRWVVLLPAGWTLCEWLRSWVLSGFPWLALGYSQLDSAVGSYAPVIGVYGVSLVVAMTAGAIVAIALGAARTRIVAAVVFAALWIGGTLLWHKEWTTPHDRPLSVALVQGAVPQTLKWQPGTLERTEDLYLSLTRPYFGADIVVWPEVAIPAVEADIRDFLTGVRLEASMAGSSLVIGMLRVDPETDDYYNGIGAWTSQDPRREQWYYKRRLVPFGEYFPVPKFVRNWMRLMSLPNSDFASGSETQAPLEVAGQVLAPTICYEDSYGAEQLPFVRRSSLLVNVSNDAWFGDSTAPHQHLDISRMRALESGRAMLRATNDGVTALIEHDGGLIATLPQFKPGVLTGRLQPRTGFTPYTHVGNTPVLILVALGLLAGFVAPFRWRTAPDLDSREARA